MDKPKLPYKIPVKTQVKPKTSSIESSILQLLILKKKMRCAAVSVLVFSAFGVALGQGGSRGCGLRAPSNGEQTVEVNDPVIGRIDRSYELYVTRFPLLRRPNPFIYIYLFMKAAYHP